MFGLGIPELLLILVIGLVLFGPGKLAESGKALGKGIREFRAAAEGKDSPKDADIREVKSGENIKENAD